MKKLKVMSVNLISFASFLAMFYAFFGLLYGIVFTFIIGVAKSLPGGVDALPIPGSIGALSIIILPVFFAITGFIGGIIFGLIINLVLKIINGLEIGIIEG